MNGPIRERRVALVLCVLAALRVFVFSAAFPFFGNVDEQSHFDLLRKYARGHIPSGLEPWDADAARIILLYGSPEYFESPGEAAASASRGPREAQSEEDRAAFEREVANLVASVNHESTQPPVYYLVAGAWYRMGGWLGFRDLELLYWTRFLNAFLYGALTWLAYRAARTAFPESGFLRLGVPLLVAFFPQDVFYAINNDVLLPLCGGAAFYGLLLIARGVRGPAFHAGTGLLVAATFLVKFSGVALLPVAAGWVAIAALRRSADERRSAFVNGAVLLAAAVVPIGAWLLRNQLVVGDVTGSAAKVRFLGWTLKPWGAVVDHPLFSPSGPIAFWRQTLATFWRGELVWGLKPLASPAWDTFYAVSSFAFIATAVVASRRRIGQRSHGQGAIVGPALALFLLSLAFLASISVAYDFGECFYPSRTLPYLTSGRLALAALIPFAVLYVSGLAALVPRRAPDTVRWALLGLPLVAIAVTEVSLSLPAFRSAYNWFHIH